jgi:hypothetical protein
LKQPLFSNVSCMGGGYACAGNNFLIFHCTNTKKSVQCLFPLIFSKTVAPEDRSVGHKMVITLLLQLLFETFFTLGTGSMEKYIEMHVGLHVKCLLDLSHCKQKIEWFDTFCINLQ